MEKRILSHRFPPFSFTTLVSRLEKGATRIDPSVARDELPANAPPKQIFAPEKETFHLSRCRRFLNVSPNLPTCRCSTHFRSQSHHATEPYSINVPPIKPRSTFRLSRIIIGRRVLRFLRFETSRKERRVGRNRNIKILSYRSRPRPWNFSWISTSDRVEFMPIYSVEEHHRDDNIANMDFTTASRGKRLNLSPSNHLSSKTPNFPLPPFPSPTSRLRKTFGRVCFSCGGRGFLDSGTGWHVTRNNEANNESGPDNAVPPNLSAPLAKILRAFLASRSYIRPPRNFPLTTYIPRYIWRSLMHYSRRCLCIFCRFLTFCLFLFLLAKKQPLWLITFRYYNHRSRAFTANKSRSLEYTSWLIWFRKLVFSATFISNRKVIEKNITRNGGYFCPYTRFHGEIFSRIKKEKLDRESGNVTTSLHGLVKNIPEAQHLR